MKNKIFVLGLFILQFTFLFSDTIIDSVYSDPILDGDLKFCQSSQSIIRNYGDYAMIIGDSDINDYISDPNSIYRSYISFELPIIPEHYFIDSCYVRLYQCYSRGQGAENQFPVWDVPYGADTLKCISSHIDYGNELDIGDWERGDEGNLYTYAHNVGTVTYDWPDGYRYVNVTSSVMLDYENYRSRSQYRIAFQIDTDWDNLADLVVFKTSNSNAIFHRPQLFIHLTDEISYSEDDNIYNNINLVNYPNPFNPITTISFSLQNDSNIELTVFNIKGQKIKTLFNNELGKGNHSIVWNGVDESKNPVSSGIYYYNLKVNNKTEVVNKCLLLK